MAQEYRGIITQGYHNDAGGQSPLRIITRGYLGALAAFTPIFQLAVFDTLFTRGHAMDAAFARDLGMAGSFSPALDREVQV